MIEVWRSAWLSYCVCFFFSSRRRHTRFDCDWSSDVCSSDLMPPSQTPAGAPAGVCEGGILGQETVAGMHGVRAGGARGIEDALNREIAFDSWRGADVHGAIGREHVRRMSIGIRENGDALDGELPARANDPQCNFAAVGDQ